MSDLLLEAYVGMPKERLVSGKLKEIAVDTELITSTVEHEDGKEALPFVRLRYGRERRGIVTSSKKRLFRRPRLIR
jgi:hypothetical protein